VTAARLDPWIRTAPVATAADMRPAAFSSERPSRVRRRQVQKSRASRISACRRTARRPRRANGAARVVGELGQHAVVVPLEEQVELGDRRAVADELAIHRLGLAVPAVQLGEDAAGSLARVHPREGIAEVGSRVELLIVGGAGGEELAQVREVVVDGEARHPCAARDLGHRGVGDALLLVQVGGRLRDPGAGLALAVGTRLQLVFPDSS
jgi:hypothetical protein